MRQAALTAAVLLAAAAGQAAPTRKGPPSLRSGEPGPKPAPELVEQVGHALSVDAVALSFDGKIVATAGKDGKAILWEAATGRTLRSILADPLGVSEVALSPDGKRLATAGAGVATLWDSQTGKALGRFGRPGEFLTGVFLSAGGEDLITVGSDGAARFWDTAAGKLRREYKIEAVRASGGALSRQATELALVSGDGQVFVFNVGSGTLMTTLTAGGAVTRAAFSRDGKMLAAGGEDGVWVWDYPSGRPRGAFKAPASRGLAFTRDGRAVITCGGNTARLWTLEGEPVRSLIGHLDAVRSLHLSSDGRRLLTGSDDRSARLWDLEDGRELRRFSGAPSPILEALVSADGRRLVTVEAQVARLWDIDTGALVRVSTGDFTASSSFSLSADGRLLAAVRDRELVDLKDLAAGQDHGAFQWNLLRATAVSLAPDGSYLTTAQDQRIQLWDAATMREKEGAPKPKRRVNRLWTALGGRRLLYLDGFGALNLWDVPRAAARADWPARGAAPPDVTLSADGAFAATAEAAGQRTVFSVRSMDDGSLLAGWDADAGATPYAFGPGGRQLLIRAGQGVWDWDVASQRPLHTWEPPRACELRWPRAVDPRWHWLVAESDGQAVFLSLNKGKALGRLSASERGWLVRAPDGRLDGSEDALRWTVGLVSHPLERFPGTRRERGLLGHLLRPAP